MDRRAAAAARQPPRSREAAVRPARRRGRLAEAGADLLARPGALVRDPRGAAPLRAGVAARRARPEVEADPVPRVDRERASSSDRRLAGRADLMSRISCD